MESTSNFPSIFHTLFLFLFSFPVILSSELASTLPSTNENSASKTKIYIVRVEPPPKITPSEDLTKWYESFLPPNPNPQFKSSQIIYSYSEAITGFAAELTDDAIKYMEKKEGFLKAYPNKALPLLTTHTPDFLGLHPGNGVWSNSQMGKGVIIGLLDSGVWPNHPSFDDAGMLDPPTKWKGKCNFDKSACNKKLIGAQTFANGYSKDPPKDMDGHGTHTASTAAGNFVPSANVLGCGNGTAVGMAPRAHLAIYKVCWGGMCAQSDVLAGMDAAIKDGVDVISISLGGGSLPFYDDVIAIGAYSAVQKGIFVSCSAGNSGPVSSSLSNEAPWLLTVGASTMDRKFRAVVKLGDGREFEGESLVQTENLPISPVVIPKTCGVFLSKDLVKDKIVVCDRSDSADSFVKRGGAVGMIVTNDLICGCTTSTILRHLPASNVNYADATAIKRYVKQSKNAVASITFKGTSLGYSPAPTIAFFSSRGPSEQTRGILKPDILGPGVNILAAWSQVDTEPYLKNETFNVISGTSMSAPHLSGVAALIKSMHPDWSPAMIKSAIMTTADVTDHDGKKPIMDEKLQPASYFSMGAGQVNPIRAVDPGLVYEIRGDDYVGLLCALGYTDAQTQTVTHKEVHCDKETKVKDVELNYPSIVVPGGNSTRLVVSRTVTNVGEPNATYTVIVHEQNGISIAVSPEKLEFSKMNEEKSFTVSLNWPPNTNAVGSLTWVSNKHTVRSPIVIF